MTAPATRRRARAWPVVVVVVGAAVVAGLVVRGDGRRSGPPYDPRSTDPDGTLAYVELLGSFGIDATAGGVPGPGTTGTVVLLADDLDAPAAAALERWVDAGGTLVVADVESPFAPPPVDSAPLRGPLDGCPIGRLDDTERLEVALARGFDPAGAPVCFAVGTGSFVVQRTVGDGTIVAAGDRSFFRNDRLDTADHAVLAVRLAEVGGGPVRVLVPAPGAEGGERLVDLVSPGVWAFGALAALAFAAYAVVRAWRFGRPVAEHQPVAVDGSELVAATGRLLERSRALQHSADLLHTELRRWLDQRYGVEPTADPGVAAAALAAEGGSAALDPATLAKALTAPEIGDQADLLEYAATVSEVRTALKDGSAPWRT